MPKQSGANKDCSYIAYKGGRCSYVEYLEYAYNARGDVTTHHTNKVKRQHPFYIVKRVEMNPSGAMILTFAVFDEPRGLLKKTWEPLTDDPVTSDEVWKNEIQLSMDMREYFQYLNDTRS